jgi:hypothetical protein
MNMGLGTNDGTPRCRLPPASIPALRTGTAQLFVRAALVEWHRKRVVALAAIRSSLTAPLTGVSPKSKVRSMSVRSIASAGSARIGSCWLVRSRIICSRELPLSAQRSSVRNGALKAVAVAQTWLRRKPCTAHAQCRAGLSGVRLAEPAVKLHHAPVGGKASATLWANPVQRTPDGAAAQRRPQER